MAKTDAILTATIVAMKNIQVVAMLKNLTVRFVVASKIKLVTVYTCMHIQLDSNIIFKIDHN